MLSILSYLRNGEYLTAIIVILSRCFVVFCCMPVHEFAHAFTANKLGDDTAKMQNRLTLNPFAHLNPIGAIMIFLFGIGYANPVPVNPARLKHPRRDMALVSLAGPISNLIMGFFSCFIYYIITGLNLDSSTAGYAVAYFFYFAASVNVTLAVFNLIPIPPLDGSKIFSAILPDKVYFKIMQYDKYIMIGLMALLFFGVLDEPIRYLSNAMMWFVSIIPRLIFG